MAQGDDSEEKTEKPTPHKLREARRRGQVSQSHELTASISLVAAVAAAALVLPQAIVDIAALWSGALRLVPRAGPADALALAGEALWLIIALGLVVSVVAAATAALVSRLQAGPVFSLEPIKPQLQHLNPVPNAQRIFSMRSVVMFLLMVAKLAVMSLGIWLIFAHFAGDAVRMVLGGSGAALAVFSQAVLWLTVWGLVGFLALSALDAAYQRWQFSRDMQMSIREMRREHKDNEGDPAMKAARKRAGKEPTARAELELVPMASLLLEDGRGRAVAVYYTPRRHPKPLFIMRAAGGLAVAMKNMCAEHGVPMVMHSALVAALWPRVAVGHPVPDAHGDAVAQLVLRFNPRVRG
jgi:type III secretion protein U